MLGIFRRTPSNILVREIKGRFDAGEAARHLSVQVCVTGWSCQSIYGFLVRSTVLTDGVSTRNVASWSSHLTNDP